MVNIIDKKSDLKKYILQSLGEPLTPIDITDEQMDNVISDAIQYWEEFNSDLYIDGYFQYEVTQEDLDRVKKGLKKVLPIDNTFTHPTSIENITCFPIADKYLRFLSDDKTNTNIIVAKDSYIALGKDNIKPTDTDPSNAIKISDVVKLGSTDTSNQLIVLPSAITLEHNDYIYFGIASDDGSTVNWQDSYISNPIKDKTLEIREYLVLDEVTNTLSVGDSLINSLVYKAYKDNAINNTDLCKISDIYNDNNKSIVKLENPIIFYEDSTINKFDSSGTGKARFVDLPVYDNDYQNNIILSSTITTDDVVLTTGMRAIIDTKTYPIHKVFTFKKKLHVVEFKSEIVFSSDTMKFDIYNPIRGEAYIYIPSDIRAVFKVLPTSSFGMSGGFTNDVLFNYDYMMASSAVLSGYLGGSVSGFVVSMEHIATLNKVFGRQQSFIGHRYQENKVYLSWDWSKVPVGHTIVLQVTRVEGPDTIEKMYNSRSLKKLALAYAKKQWADNITIHGETSMLNSIKMPVERIMNEALLDIENAHKDIKDHYGAVMPFMMG